MMKQIENKKTGVKGYIINEGEKITVELENGETKEYTVGSFKKMFKLTGEVKEEVVVNSEAQVEIEEEIATTEETKAEEVVEEVKEEEKVVEKTLTEKTIDLIKEFVENPNFNNEGTEMEYVSKATIDKVTLNKKNLIEIDIQKKAVVVYFNKATLSEGNVNRMTKLIPDSYGWSSNALFKVVNEKQLDTLYDMLVETREGKLKLDEVKAKEKEAKAEQKRLEKEAKEKAKNKQEQEAN